MPAIVSHYLLAERVMSDLSELMPDLDINRTAFIWGASGPDIFFCHRILPHQKHRSLRTVSTKMHNTPPELILNYLADYARYKCDDIAMSYALGFVTHYAFDSLAHPFILYFAEIMSMRQPQKTLDIITCRKPIAAGRHRTSISRTGWRSSAASIMATR